MDSGIGDTFGLTSLTIMMNIFFLLFLTISKKSVILYPHQTDQGIGSSSILDDHRPECRHGRAYRAYLTVFLSLSLTVILSLFFTLIWGTRVNAVRMQAEIVMDTAANSCLGEFSRELLDQYDLFFIDTSYGTNKHSEELTRQHFKKYVEANCQGSQVVSGSYNSLNRLSADLVSLTEGRFACDRNFAPVLEQIEAYMTADPAGSALDRMISLAENFEEIGLDLNEWGRQKDETNAELLAARQAWEERQAAAASEDVQEDDPVPEDPAKQVDAYRVAPILDQVFGAGSTSVSRTSVDMSQLFSHRTPNYGSGLEADNAHHYQKASTGVLNLYLFEKCGNLRNRKEGAVLDYELEYILCGEESDQANLEGVLEKLCAIRTAANCMYLFSSTARREEAQVMATAIGAVSVTPSLIPVYTTAILLAWGYVESISDLKTLTSGGKVPLLKDDASWQTGINMIRHPSAVTSAGGTGSQEANLQGGMDYETYLGILLFLQAQNDKMARLMDVCEMDIRRAEGRQTFCMDWCMDTFTASIVMNSSIGYSCQVTRTITYN